MRLGFLASGKGSNIKSILRAIDEGKLEAKHAASFFTHGRELDENWIKRRFKGLGVDYVILCGYLQKIGPIMLEAFPGHILNIHPSLLPRHGGKGMYGLKVHQRVIDFGDEYTGATVHLVDAEYDRGRILGQRKVRVFGNDTAEILKQKVFAAEELLYPTVLQQIKILNDIFGEIDH